MLINLYEVFEEFEKAPSRKEKVAVLQKHSSWALREVLKGTFHPDIKFSLLRAPSYRASDSPVGMGYTSIHQELGRAYLFEENNPRIQKGLTGARKEQILIQILESLEAREAKIYLDMLLKKQHVKGLTEAIVREAFPDLLPAKAEATTIN
jgi:hypothetical protein